MQTFYIWLPWLLAAAIFAVLVYRGRASFDIRNFLLEAAIVVVGYVAYFVVRGSTQGSETAAISHAETIADAERWLGIYWEPRMQEFVLDHDLLARAANWVYIWWHWPLIILAGVWLFLYRSDAYRIYRNAFLLSGAVGLVCFAFYPVAPPRLASAEFVDTLSRYSHQYRALEAPAFVNQYAALPSIHFGWNLLVGIALVAESRTLWLKLLGVISPIAVFLAIVVSGNHYIIDAVAGAVLCVLSLFAAKWLDRAMQRARPHPAPRGRAGRDAQQVLDAVSRFLRPGAGQG